MKILFVLEHYAPYIGGVEVLFQHLCEGLVKEQHEVTVVTSRLKGTEPFEVRNGVKTLRIKVPARGGRYWFTFFAIPHIYRAGKKSSLIHTTTYTAAPAAWLVSKILRKKCVITVHEVLGPQWTSLTGMGWCTGMIHRLLERLILYLPFSLIICVSRSTFDCLKKMGIKPERMRIAYNGIDYSLFKPAGQGEPNIRAKLKLQDRFIYTYCGRPGVTRGVEYLIQAVPHITKEIPGATLLLILAREPAPRYKYIKELIEKHTGGQDVVLLDSVLRSELPHYMAASDCVVVPSLSEGFGFFAAEASALGVPVIASGVGSLFEVVSGKHIFVEPKNPSEIAYAVKRAYRGEYDNAPRKEFRWEKCLEDHKDAYAELLGTP